MASAKMNSLPDLFERKFLEISSELSSAPPIFNDSSIRWCYGRIKELLEYNAYSGKRMRGLAVASSYLRIAGNDKNDKDFNIALKLGWAIEIMQASFLVADDIMDQSETRRGKPCWYKNNDIGLQAINDAMLLESCVFRILKDHCRNKPYYADLHDLFREVLMLTELGQSLDMATSEKPDIDFSSFTLERYISIVKYKTSFYSFYLPVATALYVAGKANSNVLQKSREILTEMGCFFQVQDDFLDCYGDPAITGKIGTDIESNKCSWLIVQAISRCSDDQKRSLEENYGKRNKASRDAVVKIFNDLKLEELYHAYEDETYSKLKSSIMEMRELAIPPEVYLDLLEKIYKRKK